MNDPDGVELVVVIVKNEDPASVMEVGDGEQVTPLGRPPAQPRATVPVNALRAVTEIVETVELPALSEMSLGVAAIV